MEYETIKEFMVDYRTELKIVGVALFLGWGYINDKYFNKGLNESYRIRMPDFKKPFKSLENILSKSL